MLIRELVKTLVEASERAAKIARAIRFEPAFSTLVEEKGRLAKDTPDFTTLADVLIQQVVKRDISHRYPALAEHVYGEESNIFTNTLGQSIEIEVHSTAGNTEQLLGQLFPENPACAKTLADIIHACYSSDVAGNEVNGGVGATDTDEMNGGGGATDADEVGGGATDAVLLSKELLTCTREMTDDALGVWIDPIDSTLSYLRGVEDEEKSSAGLYSVGLQCCMILIGVYDRTTGLPVLGVLNQPFHSKKPHNGGKHLSWYSGIMWGVCIGDLRMSSVQPTNHCATTDDQKQLIVTSRRLNSQVKEAMLQSGYEVSAPKGAGYKFLAVVEGLCSMFALDPTVCVYRWDACGPHAILRSLGGGTVDMDLFMSEMAKEDIRSNVNGSCDTGTVQRLAEKCQLLYHKPHKVRGSPDKTTWANAGGIIAYRDSGVLLPIYQVLHNVSNQV